MYVHQNIVRRNSDQQVWPADLRVLTNVGASTLYDQLVTSQGVPLNTLDGTKASDWTVLAQRMRYVVPLFRSRQNMADLDCPVFSADNLKLIFNGQVPHEKDLCFADCCQKNGNHSVV